MSVKLIRRTYPGLHRLLGVTTQPHRVSQYGGMGTSPAEDTIVIPTRIQRSSTDILKALAGTVGRDTSGPHYKYSDDPYLAPYSNLTKRSYALSKESGRKAARWIRDQNPELFTHRPDDPFIERFYPKTKYSEEGEEGLSDVGGDTLTQLVARGEVTDAITVYNVCKNKGVELGDEVLQGLLELLCFYNCEDPLEAEWVEERWYRQTSTTMRKTWKDNGLPEEVFAAISKKESPAYCALIRGMAQYFQVDRAWQLYQECREKGIPLDTGTYNALIRVASFMRDAADLRWQLVKELLGDMAEGGVEPDLGTLNATLEALTQVAGWRQAKDISLQVLAEFRQQGIQPSLATYYYLLTIHCRERGPRSHILLDILDHIEGQTFTLQDPKDISFFVTAMQVARNHVKSMEAAQRVDAFLHKGEHKLLIGDSYKESVYYRHYFAVSCATLPIDEFMNMYEELVPHVYTPEPGIMEEVIETVRVSGALHHLPKLWSDMILFDYTTREKIVALMLSSLTEHHPPAQDEELTRRLATIAKDIWRRVQEQDPGRRNRIQWTGHMVGDVLEVLVRCGEYHTAQEVLREASTAPQNILGFLSAQALTTLLTAAVERKHADTAVDVVLYSQDAGHQETGQMAVQVRSSLPLTARQRAKITSVAGLDAIFTDPPNPTAPTPGT